MFQKISINGLLVAKWFDIKRLASRFSIWYKLCLLLAEEAVSLNSRKRNSKNKLDMSETITTPVTPTATCTCSSTPPTQAAQAAPQVQPQTQSAATQPATPKAKRSPRKR
jgi:citrate synthase